MPFECSFHFSILLNRPLGTQLAGLLRPPLEGITRFMAQVTTSRIAWREVIAQVLSRL
jgi:hypothetical protein